MMITIDTIDERLAQSEQVVTLITDRDVRLTGLRGQWHRFWIARNHHPTLLEEEARISNSAAKNQGGRRITDRSVPS